MPDKQRQKRMITLVLLSYYYKKGKNIVWRPRVENTVET